MKKFQSIFLMAILSIAVFTFASCSSDDDSNPQKHDDPAVTFMAPCLDWNKSIDDVRKYMSTNLPDYREQSKTETTSEGVQYTFNHKIESTSYSYTFKDDKLKRSDIAYFGSIKPFESIKAQITEQYGITEWKQYQSGVIFWLAKIPAKNANVNISCGDSGMEYVAVGFEYSGF